MCLTLLEEFSVRCDLTSQGRCSRTQGSNTNLRGHHPTPHWRHCHMELLNRVNSYGKVILDEKHLN